MMQQYPPTRLGFSLCNERPYERPGVRGSALLARREQAYEVYMVRAYLTQPHEVEASSFRHY